MFGSSNPFGQASTSPFGQTQSAFGQATTATNNPFAPKPFGSPTTTFGQQTGSSLFGNMSAGAFGQQQPTQAFGTPSSSSSPFGSSTPAFGASHTPAFGATTSTFGSGSLFGQKPSFGGFGSAPSQSSPFGSTLQQTQPTFGSSTFGSTTTPAFGAPTTPAFGTTTAPAFGATTAPTFGSTSTSLFGGSSTPMFGSSTPGFGASNAPSFGTSTSAFNFGSSPSSGQTAASFGSSPFGTTPAFGAQTSPFGSQPAAPTFGQAPFGNQAGGTRIKPYAQTPDADGSTSGTQPAAKLDSISAMPEYINKSPIRVDADLVDQSSEDLPLPHAGLSPVGSPVGLAPADEVPRTTIQEVTGTSDTKAAPPKPIPSEADDTQPEFGISAIITAEPSPQVVPPPTFEETVNAPQAMLELVITPASTDDLPAAPELVYSEGLPPSAPDVNPEILPSTSELLGFDVADFDVSPEDTTSATPESYHLSVLKSMLEVVQIPVPQILHHLNELEIYFSGIESLLPSSVGAAIRDVLQLRSIQADIKSAYERSSKRQAQQQASRILSFLIIDAREQKKTLDALADSRASLESSLSGLKAEERRLEDELRQVRSRIQAVEEEAASLPTKIQAQKDKVAIAVKAVSRQIPLTASVLGDDAADQAILDSSRDLLKNAASAISALFD